MHVSILVGILIFLRMVLDILLFTIMNMDEIQGGVVEEGVKMIQSMIINEQELVQKLFS